MEPVPEWIDLGRLAIRSEAVVSFGLVGEHDSECPLPAGTPFVICDNAVFSLTASELARVRKAFGFLEIPQDNVLKLTPRDK